MSVRFVLSLLSTVYLLQSVIALRASTGLSGIEISSFVLAHNAIRAAHHAPSLSWSNDLAGKAASWSDQCLFQHTGGILRDQPYGELHVAATGNFPIMTAIQQFANDAADFDPVNVTFSHWTQIVWKSTTTVGCAIARCNDLLGPKTGQASYYACLYDPAGNVLGEAAGNIEA